MLITTQIQMHDDAREVELVMATRNDLYHLILMFEGNSNVKAWRIVQNGKIIGNPHLAFSFSKAIEMTKYNAEEFVWV